MKIRKCEGGQVTEIRFSHKGKDMVFQSTVADRDVEKGLKKIADYYGYEAQSRQTIEELSELIQAICKHIRAFAGEKEPWFRRGPERDAVIEEIADVTIMLWQVEYLLKISGDEIEDIICGKTERQLKRMDQNEKAHNQD